MQLSRKKTLLRLRYVKEVSDSILNIIQDLNSNAVELRLKVSETLQGLAQDLTIDVTKLRNGCIKHSPWRCPRPEH